ncbi:hypothetical protein SAMN05444396_103361 [Flavobacterium segetis]|uniref:Uncharacterized protein n=1 Tax=Flavobacterium segetis TaxID=271157 RepID=A0A1M5G979_9FLAO|nr:hypothetical protein [Flavobacterium segetis]SHG00266.1 hypothetical protein SAMN05444396_103361 [Flavobacterium segetis]
MKTKIIFLTLFMLTASFAFSQNKNTPRSIISSGAAIKKYHELEELKRMQKGELLDLYVERIQVLVKTLPYIALATKPGITIADLGIPYNSENKKTMEDQADATASFLDTTVNFQRKMVPYSDKDNLISAILFYENTMRALHEFSSL